MTDRPLPYAGVRILDFSRLLPGGWCSQFLADCGADVIKVEHPDGGDYARHNPPTFRHSSVYFTSVNRNKRSVVLDLRNPHSRPAVQRLLASADVVLESFRPGVPERLGVDYATARTCNERVVYCSLTGFGQDGPLADHAGHDLNIQGLSGLMMLGVEPGQAPRPPGFMAADYAGAVVACMGIMLGLASRERSGQGSYLDVSMFDALMSMCNIVMTAPMSLLGGGTGRPAMASWGDNPRYSVYVAGDGLPVSVSLLEPKFWKLFCEAAGRPELYNEAEQPHERLSDHGERNGLYRQAIVDFCAAYPRDELVRRTRAAGIPLFAVCTPDEALAMPLLEARGMLEFVDHPREGRIPQLGNPLARSGLVASRGGAAPDLGAHTDEVLDELGFSAAERAELERQGAIRHERNA